MNSMGQGRRWWLMRTYMRETALFRSEERQRREINQMKIQEPKSRS